METRFFETPAEFRAWLAKNHATAGELGVVLHRKASGKPTMTWSEAVDQALCFGWIDGIARRIDDTSRVQRFTPRRPKSNWSAVNIKKVEVLTAQGLMTPAGQTPIPPRHDSRSRRDRGPPCTRPKPDTSRPWTQSARRRFARRKPHGTSSRSSHPPTG